MRARSASPMSMFLPETRNGMTRPLIAWFGRSRKRALPQDCPSPAARSSSLAHGRRGSGRERGLLLPPTLHRGGDAHGLAIFCDGSPRDVDPRRAQLFHDGIVGQDLVGAFGVDELADAVAHRLRGMGLPAVRRRDRRGEEIFQLEYAA